MKLSDFKKGTRYQTVFQVDLGADPQQYIEILEPRHFVVLETGLFIFDSEQLAGARIRYENGDEEFRPLTDLEYATPCWSLAASTVMILDQEIMIVGSKTLPIQYFGEEGKYSLTQGLELPLLFERTEDGLVVLLNDADEWKLRRTRGDGLEHVRTVLNPKLISLDDKKRIATVWTETHPIFKLLVDRFPVDSISVAQLTTDHYLQTALRDMLIGRPHTKPPFADALLEAVYDMAHLLDLAT